MKLVVIVFSILGFSVLYGQSYHSAAGTPSTNAIHKDSSVFIAWASACVVERGFVNISDTTVMAGGSNRASFGTESEAVGIAEGNSANVVSLGDNGVATLTFDSPIVDGPGYDFAVFENSFSPTFLELAHVEVSSDGVNFVRFESTSETSTAVQVGGFGSLDPTYINNLAGKYHGGYGVPFDLQELDGNALLDLNNITHVRIIDVVGSIESSAGTMDAHGTMINDPFPTPFESSGFDLDGVGVIHNQNEFASTNELSDLTFSVFPNPNAGSFYVRFGQIQTGMVQIFSIEGKLMKSKMVNDLEVIHFDTQLLPGQYILRIQTKDGQATSHLIIQ